MVDPIVKLAPVFRAAIVQAFGPAYAQVDPLLRPSQHADYQANVALGLGKALGRPPRDVAAAIEKELRSSAIAKAEIAGPGFINIWLDDATLSAELGAAASSALGLEPARPTETVVIDYSSPNVAKEMHVGHLRSTIIGDALARVLEALGHRVIRQNHLGDWGTPFGMLIEHLLDAAAQGSEHSVSDLNAFYQAARQKFDADPSFAERARKRVVLLQGGDPDTLALWNKLVDASKRYFGSVYARLGISLSDADIAGESLYNPMLPGIVAELENKGLAKVDAGAVCVFPPGFKGRDEQPLPLIIKKQDGGYGYATTDLAGLRHRIEKLGATRIIYVVGSPQAQHLAMVFETAKLAGWLAPPVRAEHVGFGSVLGSDKKMFKTRSATGQTVRLIDLLDEAVRRAAEIVGEKNPSLSESERGTIARAVGIGAVKYADLSSDRIKDYVFDWDRMLSFDGNTAPYLQYAHARIRSIFRKGETEAPPPSAIAVREPAERALGKKLLAFPSVVEEVATSLEPHKLCGYLYDLATAFSSFYESCPVLKAEGATRASRLALSDLSARVMARGLGLLGIEAPERM
jgi:arginyl-tRNA synthetase